MAIVTISRVLGSSGDEIALKVAENLGYNLVDNTLIVKVAERAGVSVESAASYDEKYQSRMVEWLKSFLEPRMGKIIAEGSAHLDPEKYIEYCKTVILGLAEQGNMVIVGRAGQCILRDKDNAFHVRIVASDQYRIERTQERHDISASDALEMIKKSDRMRKHYIERYLKMNWEDPLAYHLILDSSKLGVDLASVVIVNAVENFSKTREYIPGVRDRRSDANRREKDRRRGDRRDVEIGWTQKQAEHALLRNGRPPRTHSKPDRRKSRRRKQGRRSIDE